MFKEELEKIRKEAQQRLEQSDSLDKINEIRVGVLGKKGSLKDILKGMKNVPAEERPKVGQMVNDVRVEIEEAIAKAQKTIERKVQEQRLAAETIDVTLPAKRMARGHSHPNVIALKEMERIFVGMGYEVIEGPEVERDYYNFEALNIPADHPAKDEQDTFYINGDILLRTQTSSTQIHAMELFGEETRTRFRPHHFPFTEPSAEMDVSCFKCGGKGCSFCKGEGWIEILGCGMVHPHVLEMSGIDPDVYSGFAFGVGLERIALLNYEIDDMRLLYENDIRFLNQF